MDIIYRTLEETGLMHDEGPDKDGGCGPYVQSERQWHPEFIWNMQSSLSKKAKHITASVIRRASGILKTERRRQGNQTYTINTACILSKEEVEANLAAGKPFVIRQNNPTEGTTTFHDEIYGDITVDEFRAGRYDPDQI